MVVLGTLEMSGVTGSEGADSEPLPTALVACTVKVYEVLLVSPETIALPVLEPGAGAATVEIMPVATPFTNALTV